MINILHFCEFFYGFILLMQLNVIKLVPILTASLINCIKIHKQAKATCFVKFIIQHSP